MIPERDGVRAIGPRRKNDVVAIEPPCHGRIDVPSTRFLVSVSIFPLKLTERERAARERRVHALHLVDVRGNRVDAGSRDRRDGRRSEVALRLLLNDVFVDLFPGLVDQLVDLASVRKSELTWSARRRAEARRFVSVSELDMSANRL